MQDRLEALLNQAKTELSAAATPELVEQARVRYLGKKGELSAVLGGMGKLPADQRKAVGEIVNKVKGEIEALPEGAVRRADDARLDAEL
jgi:phenylalanyl-tRNA synthetase alpha chain